MDTSKTVEVHIINAFVDQDSGGNPAGLVLDADDLSSAEKLKIAAKVGLSETAFVSRSSIATIKLDFFTPNRQIAHCGHATIATFSYLRQLGKINNNHVSKETIDGTRAILLSNELAFMEQKAPKYYDATSHKEMILKSLSITKKDIIKDAPILVANTGNSFLLVPVASPTILKNIQPDFNVITQVSEVFDLIGYYVFTTQTDQKKGDAAARMFGPRYHIQEEAGTGMAAGPLACYLYDILNIKKSQFFIQQGRFMKYPSPSLIIVDLILENDIIIKLMAGGKGIHVKSLEITI